VEDTVTKPSTAQRQEPRLATTVVEKVTFPRIVLESQKPKLAISVVKKVTFRVIAHKPTLPPPRVGTLGGVGAAVKSATSVGKSVTLLATVPAEVPAAVAAVLTAVVLAVVLAAAVPARKLATLVAVLDTFLATADRVPNVTTVLDMVTSVGNAPSPRSVLATPVARKDISPVTVPARVRRRRSVSSRLSSTLSVPYLFR